MKAMWGFFIKKHYANVLYIHFLIKFETDTPLNPHYDLIYQIN